MRKPLITFLVSLLILISCAKVVAPSGGPVDDTPPEVTEVFPQQGFVEETPSEITIYFSEKIRASESDIQLYPESGGIAVIKGNEAHITIGVESAIVLVNLSSTLEDMRGNKIVNPETFVWNSIPEDSFASVSVSLLRDGGGIVTANARCDFFLLPDTVSPAISHYPDTLGVIDAGWLSPGDYMVLGYEDFDQSRTWDPEREPGTASEISLASGDYAEFAMTMTIIDSIGPRISELLVTDGWHLEVIWNEQIGADFDDSELVSITGPDSLPVNIYSIGTSSGRSTNGRMTVYTEQMADTMYTITVRGITDLAGNPSLPDTIEFWGTDSLPASKLSVQYAFPIDGGIDIPPTGPFYITFSDWVDETAVDSLYSISRVADSVVVSGEFVRMSALGFSFTPFDELLGNRQYRTDLLPGIVSLQGDSLAGASWAFIPAWSESPGIVSGSISGTSASVVTMVFAPAGSSGEILTGDYTRGTYSFPDIPGGRYTVSAFVDWNSDNVWNPGEPYGAWPGVVEVFPGIETPDILIKVLP